MDRPASHTRETRGRLLLSGFCFAMAFITKPSFVLHTLLLYAYSVALVVVAIFPCAMAAARWIEGSSRLSNPSSCSWCPLCCVAVPYYALDWQHIADYIWSNTRGDKAIFGGFLQATSTRSGFTSPAPLLER